MAAGAAAIAIYTGAYANGAEIREVKGGYEVQTDAGIVSVQPFTSEIFRVTSLPKLSLIHI